MQARLLQKIGQWPGFLVIDLNLKKKKTGIFQEWNVCQKTLSNEFIDYIRECSSILTKKK